ncbi:MAG: rRNA maturation RNase YbeY [Lysobacterales bacterium]|jgi:probable rRNA maturation factor
MTIEVEVQVATSFEPIPDQEAFARWAGAALQGHDSAIVTVRLVDREESRRLNDRFRGIDRPTNVLSFPAGLPAEIGIPLLGDLVICAPLVEAEALDQGKSPTDHWAHLTVHGVLHLLGYDHTEASAARKMEAIEVRVLETLGIANPYD